MFSVTLKALAGCAVLFGSCLQLQGVLVEAGQQAATIRHIAVTGDHDDLRIEITATAPITPLIQTVTDPDRLIVDIPEARPSADLHKIVVNRGKVRDIRIGLRSANPPIARVVLDLTAPTTQYKVSRLDNSIAIKLSNEFPESGSESRSAPEPVAPTTKPAVEARPVDATPVVATPPPDSSSERGRAHWILPILLMVTVAAMLVIALVVHIQNRRVRRGL
jgi:N-acetylmuramoyl-L-alanine amidase